MTSPSDLDPNSVKISTREVVNLRGEVAKLKPLEFLLAKGGDPVQHLSEAVLDLSAKVRQHGVWWAFERRPRGDGCRWYHNGGKAYLLGEGVVELPCIEVPR